MKGFRVWAEIDHRRLSTNLAKIEERVGAGVGVLLVVKADAYGHGAIPISHTALRNGVRSLGVGDSTEAIELRQAGVLAPILVLGALIEEEISAVVSYAITPTVHSLDMVHLIEDEARRQCRRVKVHLKVDTGLSRLGASPAKAVELAKRVTASKHLELEGIGTHFSASYTDSCFTEKQLEEFLRVVCHLESLGIPVPYRHAANSAALVAFPSARLNLVRTGRAAYGIDPGLFRRNDLVVEPVLSLKTRVAFLKGIRADTPVGYNRTFVAPRATRLATLPVGFDDGYPSALSNKAQVLVRGQRAPVVGTVTMDYMTVDVGHIADVKVGDEVVLVGRQGQDEIRITDLADLFHGSALEIACSLGRRVRRISVPDG